MLPAPNPVAPHRCMTSRKNVSLLNKGFCKHLHQISVTRQRTCITFFLHSIVADPNNVVNSLTITVQYLGNPVCHLQSLFNSHRYQGVNMVDSKKETFVIRLKLLQGDPVVSQLFCMKKA